MIVSFLCMHFSHQYILRVVRLLFLMDGIVGAYLIVFAFPSMLFPIQQFHVIYLSFISTTAICYLVVCSLLEDCVQYHELICRCLSSTFINYSITAPMSWPPCSPHILLYPFRHVHSYLPRQAVSHSSVGLLIILHHTYPELTFFLFCSSSILPFVLWK